jgi:integrase
LTLLSNRFTILLEIAQKVVGNPVGMVGIMEIKAKVFKRASGKSKGKWIVRLEYFDELSGVSRCIERQAIKRSEVVDLRDRLTRELQQTGAQIRTGDGMTFDDLAALCEATFYQPATIVEGRKIAGVRSLNTAQVQIKNLRRFFGKRKLRNITTESLVDYKLWRLKQGSLNPTIKKPRPVKLATINRELSAMRRMMRFAFSQGWILRDVFFNTKIIEASAEVERTRLLTQQEEARLLASCQGERLVTYSRRKRLSEAGETEQINAIHQVDNPRLKAMIILALDSGMRRGEIFKLRWEDIDFENGLIRIVGTHTKTERERLAPLSSRAIKEFERLKNLFGDEQPFPLTDIKRSFATAKRIAGIEDLHFHDLRRSAITRWIQSNVPLAIAGKLAGHSQPRTTMKHYISTDEEIVRSVSHRMNLVRENITAATAMELESSQIH